MVIFLNRKFYFLLILIVISLVGCENSDEYKSLKDHVEVLTSDDMNGRYTGTKGNDLAGDFIYTKFEELGLIPFLANNYKMNYSHQFYDPNKARHQLVVTSENNEILEFERGIDYLERSGFSDYNETFQFTFNIKDEDLMNSYIVLENPNNFQEAYAQAKGFFLFEDTFTNTILVDKMEKPIIQISKKMYNAVKKMKQGTIHLSMSQEKETIEASNIVGKIAGKESENAVVISAHFDHVGSIGNTIYRGAIDNASGVALLLDIAEKLTKSDASFSKDIIFAAFNGEESGLQGSYAFTEQLEGMYENIYNINLDSFYDGPVLFVSEESELTSNLLKDLMDIFTLHEINSSFDLTGGFTSDHSNFLQQHLNALTISSQKVSSRIHKETDTIDDINFSFLNNVSDAVVDFIKKYDHEPYAHIHEHRIATDSNNMIEQKKIISEETEKLSYGEFKYFELDKENKEYTLLRRDFYVFEDFNEFKQHYPTIKYSSEVYDYQLKKISVKNTFDESISWDELEINKIYQREILLKDLSYLVFSYYKPNNLRFDISIEKGKLEIDSELIYEKKTIQNIPLSLRYDTERSELLMDVTYFKEVNGQIYTIDISKGEEVWREFYGVQSAGIKTDLTIPDLEDLIQNKGLMTIIEDMLETL